MRAELRRWTAPSQMDSGPGAPRDPSGTHTAASLPRLCTLYKGKGRAKEKVNEAEKTLSGVGFEPTTP